MSKINISSNNFIAGFRITAFIIILLIALAIIIAAFLSFRNHARYISLIYKKAKNKPQKK